MLFFSEEDGSKPKSGGREDELRAQWNVAGGPQEYFNFLPVNYSEEAAKYIVKNSPLCAASLYSPLQLYIFISRRTIPFSLPLTESPQDFRRQANFSPWIVIGILI